MTIKNNYTIGDLVVLVTDPEKFPRIVTGILVQPSGLRYELALSELVTYHLEIEIEKCEL